MKRIVACCLAVVVILCMSFAAISTSAADANFAPSIEEKPVPEIVAPEIDDGADLGGAASADIGAVINKVEEETKEYVEKIEVFTLYYDKAKDLVENKDTNALSPEKEAVCNTLIEVYEALKENGVRNSVEGIDDFVAENLEISNPEYFVSYVFELSLSGKYDGELDGVSTVTVRFDNTGIRAEEGKFVVAHIVEGKWVLVPSEDVKVAENYVEVTFDSLCPILFLNVEEGDEETTTDTTPGGDETESESETETEDEETQTPGGDVDDDDNNDVLTATIIIILITLLIIIAIVVFYILEKKGVIAKISKKSKE